MSFLPIGFLIGMLAFAGSLLYLKQSVAAYYDVVALLMVLGGTIASAVMVIPWELKKEVKWAFSKIFKRAGFPLKEVVQHCEYSIKNKVSPPEAENRIYGDLLKEGYELSALGIETEKIEAILHERLQARLKRLRRLVGVIRGISKYPPAFGLMGTVLGLVNVMKGVAKGMPASETALEMALALVATMYGLIMANLIIGPFGEILTQSIQGEEYAGEIAISAVTLSLTEDSELVTSEFLQSYLSGEDRSNSSEGAAA